MGRRPEVEHVANALFDSVCRAQGLVQSVTPLAAFNPHTSRALHPKHVRSVIELAFMGVCASWEDFLEDTLVRYLAGAASQSGYSPVLRIGHCQNLSHAYQILTGNPDHNPEKRFMTLSDPDKVRDLAKVFFKGGEPYETALKRWGPRLRDASVIRNRVAHRSDKCIKDFAEVARKHLDPSGKGRLHQGYRVGDLLLAPAAPLFGKAAQGDCFIAYLDMFCDAARMIVPG